MNDTQMNETPRQLLQRLFREIQQGDQRWRRDFKNHCENEVLQLLRGSGNDAAEWERLLVTKNIPGPGLGQGAAQLPRAQVPRSCREPWESFGRIARNFWIEGGILSRENYLKFRRSFFDLCMGNHPRLVFNRLVVRMFPNQFFQVPNENEFHIVYEGLARMGAFAQYPGPANIGDMEARWFDENTATMVILRDALGDIEDEYYLGDVGWHFVEYFTEHQINKPNKKRSTIFLQNDVPAAPFTMGDFISARYSDRGTDWVANVLRRMKPHKTWLESQMTIRRGPVCDLPPNPCDSMTFGNPVCLTLVTGNGHGILNGKKFPWHEARRKLFDILQQPMSNFHPIITDGNA